MVETELGEVVACDQVRHSPASQVWDGGQVTPLPCISGSSSVQWRMMTPSSQAGDCAGERWSVENNLCSEALLGFLLWAFLFAPKCIFTRQRWGKAVEPSEEIVGWKRNSWLVISRVGGSKILLLVCFFSFFLSFFLQTWRDVFGYEVSLWVF